MSEFEIKTTCVVFTNVVTFAGVQNASASVHGPQCLPAVLTWPPRGLNSAPALSHACCQPLPGLEPVPKELGLAQSQCGLAAKGSWPRSRGERLAGDLKPPEAPGPLRSGPGRVALEGEPGVTPKATHPLGLAAQPMSRRELRQAQSTHPLMFVYWMTPMSTVLCFSTH